MKPIIMLALVFMSIVSCITVAQSGFKNAPVAELTKIKNEKNAIVIDVRTPAEWQQGVIEGADIFIDYNGGNFEQ